MRFGIFGGSFDPPHLGHFLTALDAAEQLKLDRVLWVPAAQQPLKTEAPHGATPEQRWTMVSMTVQGLPLFVPSRIEMDRDGLSYTVTTVEALAREYPSAERILLVGEDAWRGFGEWHQPERIRSFVQIAVLRRPGGSGAGDGEGDATPPMVGSPAEHQLTTRLVDVSSSEIRARVRAGKPVRGFVHDEVAAFIDSEGLYRW